jgi:prevent-host-death family protein
MISELPITEVRRELTSLPEKMAEDLVAIAVTRRGKPVLAIMPWELYESLVEMLEIMGDQETMAALRQGIQEVREQLGR